MAMQDGWAARTPSAALCGQGWWVQGIWAGGEVGLTGLGSSGGRRTRKAGERWLRPVICPVPAVSCPGSLPREASLPTPLCLPSQPLAQLRSTPMFPDHRVGPVPPGP